MGQNTAEYAILIALVVGVAVVMQTYVKRGIQARVHDEVGAMATETSELGETTQYEPYYLESNFTTVTTKDSRTKTGAANNPKTEFDSAVNQSGTQILTGIAP